ncbi:penicillin-binding protein activator [Sneathiella limimaris]|uniref:penicillin-binding protein activator n=1 Tax=Sneathiella limimaris TaxID=1964213 RepID=UPI001469A57A|nr:penicillin-binding protein activator [Sneathiella limimaris]
MKSVKEMSRILITFRLGLVLIAILTLSACQTLGPFSSSEKTDAEKTEKAEAVETTPKTEEPASDELEEEAAEATPAPSDTFAGSEMRSGIQLERPLLSEDEKVVRLAILLPLSGANKKIGTDLLNAANMALFDHNNKQLRLQPYDTQGTPEGAREAALKAVSEGAEVFMGPLFASSVRAIEDIAAANNINVLAFSTDASVAKQGVYLMGLTVEQQISRVLDFAYRQGLANFAVLAPQNPYGEAALSAIDTTTRRLGLTLTKVKRYPTDLPPGSEELHEIAKDTANYDARNWVLRQEIKKVEGKSDPESKALLQRLQKLDTFGDVNFEALILPEGGQRLRELAPLLSYYDIDPQKVKYIGTGLWADTSLTTEPALVGGWFAAPAPEAHNQFLQRFNGIYGYVPPRIASLAYDAMALCGLLALDETTIDKFSVVALESTEGFTGYNGLFRFTNTGLAERGLAVMQLGQDKLELLEPAPNTFTPALN